MFMRKEPYDPECVAPGPHINVLAQEVAHLPPEQCLLTSGHYTVMYARAHQIPNLLYEIGRLREITFRRVGEGTGRSVDLDRFDLYYTHLFVWNRTTREVVGAYRLGQVDRIVPRFGKEGLYTNGLFDYKEGFLGHISAGVELGRSFVRPTYQKQYGSLLLLWKGIGHFITRHPQHCILFGPVTISNAYGPLSRQILISYLTINHFAPELARLVKPRALPSAVSLKRRGMHLVSDVPKDIDELSALISDLEADRKGVPVLLRQYLKLGGRLMAFTIDPSFGNGLDGLLMVDLRRCDRKILIRYMGDEGAATFLGYHESVRAGDLASQHSQNSSTSNIPFIRA